jgi:hypothetical protein
MEPHLEALLTEHERLLDEIVSDQEHVTFSLTRPQFLFQSDKFPNLIKMMFFKINNCTTRKQLNEEALKTLRRGKQKEQREHWICGGDCFIKLPHDTITQILEKGPFFPSEHFLEK